MRLTLVLIALLAFLPCAFAQQESQSSGVRRYEVSTDRQSAGASQASAPRPQSAAPATSDADIQWMRVIYRQIDLTDDQNASLYFPEDPIDGQENLFRMIMRLLCNGEIPAYEYLDGREIFTDKYKVNLTDVFNRFYIPYTEAKGSSEKNPKYDIDESDVPTNEVLSYYIIERWVYDTRTNRMKTYIDAICPILHRAGEYGGDALKFPMFWIKFDDLAGYLKLQPIFVSDDNNLATYTYADFFDLNMYKGDIYKTRNHKNLSLMQMYPDPDELKHAQDSIQASLDNFEKKLWVPDREEVLAAREAAEAAAAQSGSSLDDVVAAPVKETAEDEKTVRTTKRGEKETAKTNKKAKAQKPKAQKPKASSSSSSAVKSVRRKK